MDSMGLPMSFGKKAKAASVNIAAKVDKTKRDDVGRTAINSRCEL